MTPEKIQELKILLIQYMIHKGSKKEYNDNLIRALTVLFMHITEDEIKHLDGEKFWEQTKQ
jgi:hypothetical protein